MLERVIAAGDVIEVGGDLRTITSLVLGSGGFNDAGQIAFRAGFADGGQGVFLGARAPATPVDPVQPVPLPAGAPLLLTALAAFAFLRRRA